MNFPKAALISALIIFSAASSKAAAQKKDKYQFTPGSDISLSIGCSPIGSSYSYFGYFDDYYLDWTHYINKQADYPTIAEEYSGYQDVYRGNGYISGSINVGYTYKFVKWFEFTAYANYSGYYRDYYDNTTNQKAFSSNVHTFGVTAFARFLYLNKRYVKLYSGLGLGLGCCLDEVRSKSNVEYDSDLTGNLTATIFGVRAGGKVYGFVELNIGTLGMATAGIGIELGK